MGEEEGYKEMGEEVYEVKEKEEVEEAEVVGRRRRWVR